MDIRLTINGDSYEVNPKQVPIDMSLNTYIRDYAKLTGTKFMCRKGGCGACTVTVGRSHPATQTYETFALNSCLKPLLACDGMDITTIEGLGDKRRGYHPLQIQLNECAGTQCGYCSPGMIMNMHGLMSAGVQLSKINIEKSFSGNICRCTGYRPILQAMKSFAFDDSEINSNSSEFGNNENCFDIEDLTGYCPKRSPPINLQKSFTVHSSQNQVWYRVITFLDLLATLDRVPDNQYMLVAGNTVQGVSPIPSTIKSFIDISSVPEMHDIHRTVNSISIGSLLTLSETIIVMTKTATAKGFEYLLVFVEHLELMANVQLGTIGGNLNHKQQHPEFQSDIFLLLDTIDALLTIIDCSKNKHMVRMTEFLTMDMNKKVLFNIILPRIDAPLFIRTYRVAIRAQNAHAYVNAGFNVRTLGDGTVISARICYGGIHPSFTHAYKTELFLKNRNLYSNDTLQEALSTLSAELHPDWCLPDADPEYRKILAIGYFYRFVLSICPLEQLSKCNISGATTIRRELSSGIQNFTTIEKNWPLTKPVVKYEGLQQASGEAKFINDMPRFHDELWAAFAVATKVHETVAAINPAEALASPGARFFFEAKHIPGRNNFTPRTITTFYDEQIFIPIGGEVLYHGQPVGVLLADSYEEAVFAARKVKILYNRKNLKGVQNWVRSLLSPFASPSGQLSEKNIFSTISDLPKNKIQFPPETSAPPFTAPQRITGSIELLGQYHNHMENQCVVVVPNENELAVYSSTQWLDFTQNAIAECLAIPTNHINIILPRIGGGFGAKISRSTLVACAAALCSTLTNRPVRFSMTLEANMKSIGKRCGTIGQYAVEVNSNGRIQNLTNTFVQDAGCSLNEPFDACTKGAFPNCYDSTGWTVNGEMLLTDSASNTFCRCPSAMEGIGMVESIMEHISEETDQDPMAIRLVNMAADSPMRQMSTEFMQSIDFKNRKIACDDFNATNRWIKRGIAVVPMKWPQIYLGSIYGYVAIYNYDGSVAVTHSGVECGQGINTKVAQVAAFTLGIPLESISIKPNSNVTSANSIVTGSSSTSEMSCFAIRKACNILLERIRPVRSAMKVGYTWPQLIAECYNRNIDLRANGVFDASDLATYSIYGMACAEVQLDVLTGVSQIERVDIWEDVGQSMSPLVDVGQVEGAFVMGIGYYLTEELIYDRTTGELLTDSTWTYKPPGALDIPIDFRVTFIQNSSNPNAGVLHSKATGEPALAMSIVVVFALRNAIKSSRKDAGLPNKWISLGSATTPEKICLAIGNEWRQFCL